MLLPAIVLPSLAIINVHDLIANSPEISFFFFLPSLNIFALFSSSHFNSITFILLLILFCPRVAVLISLGIYTHYSALTQEIWRTFATNNKVLIPEHWGNSNYYFCIFLTDFNGLKCCSPTKRVAICVIFLAIKWHHNLNKFWMIFLFWARHRFELLVLSHLLFQKWPFILYYTYTLQDTPLIYMTEGYG